MVKTLKVCKQALGSLAIENQYPSLKGLKITSDFIKGKIDSKEAIRRIKEVYNL
jgi:hypothetical protein